MSHEFDRQHSVHIHRDDEGVARGVLHVETPYVATAGTPQAAAREYLDRFGDLLGINHEQLRAASLAPTRAPIDAPVEYRFLDEKSQFDTTTVVFSQTVLGLPIYEAGVSVQLRSDPPQVIGAQSTLHVHVQITPPSKGDIERVRTLKAAKLREQLGLARKQQGLVAKSIKILSQKLIVYRYDETRRLRVRERKAREETTPNPPLRPLPKSIENGRHYVAAEVVFILPTDRVPDLHWIAIIEAKTLAVLRVIPLIDDVHGLVFPEDPMTDNGGPAPSAPSAQLNPDRRSVFLRGLAPPSGGNYALVGDLIQLSDAEPPPVAPPTEPVGTDFNFDARTDNFAAVNAYYHCDRFFRLVQGLGFDVHVYFGGTLFPTIVDHRGMGITINAHCLGNGSFGILRTAFALADLTDLANPLGLACDYRVALHELGGHGVLYSFVNGPNFGFAHSSGDSFGAVLCDPKTKAPDRFETFPWVYNTVPRRHDRTVSSGWAWGGVNDTGGYNSEQILCTTHFRIYRAIGGDSTELAMREFASVHLPYLILRAIGTLTPATNPPNALGFALAEMSSSIGDWTSRGELGGYYWKVIRWAYEKQGLFQPPGAPTPVVTPGAPPPIDVYIDDGRTGEYYYGPGNEFGAGNIYPHLQRFWETTTIWNRLEPDGHLQHQTPAVGKTNYAYVKVHNRGTQSASLVTVHAYHSRPAAGLVWPDDWKPMSTASLPIPGSIPPGGEIVVGPFEWRPNYRDHDCMLMSVSAPGDLANNNPASLLPCASGPAPLWQLVPCDNNLGLRAVIPVPGGGRRRALKAAFRERRFWASNPLATTAKIEVRPILPNFLLSRGWSMHFDNPGGGSFSLGSHDSREVRPRLTSGQDFTAAEVIAASNVSIVIAVLADGLIVGGFTFVLDPHLRWPPHQYEDEDREEEKELADRRDHDKNERGRPQKIKFEVDLD